MSLTQELVISFVNKISNELAQNELKSNRNFYKLKDILCLTFIDINNKFTERPWTKIVKTQITQLKMLTDIFGNDNGSKNRTMKNIKK